MIFNDYNDSTSALRALTGDLLRLIEAKPASRPFHLALSGGSTARLMFTLWRDEYAGNPAWLRVHFLWVDERCVPPTDAESNYGEAQRLFFTPLHIAASHVHRINGEAPPEEEAARYERLARQLLGMEPPDAIILGVGPDFHTASIFPHSLSLLTDERLYAPSRHPVSGQRRVTMTGSLILSGAPLFVPLLGSDKTAVISHLKADNPADNATPAAYIIGTAREATIYAAPH